MSVLKVNEYECSLAEVAEELGLSRERVRQIEMEALKKLRVALEAKGLTSTILDEENVIPFADPAPDIYRRD